MAMVAFTSTRGLDSRRQARVAPARIRIGIVDDHVFIRDVMKRLLERQKTRYEVVWSVGTSRDALAACQELRPDLLILDINLPDRNGIDALPDLKRLAPKTRVLLCTAYASDHSMNDLVQSGADGFVEKTSSWDDFLGVINRVNNGEKYFCAKAVTLRHSSSIQRHPVNSSHLTPRENEIVGLVAAGLTSKEIAAKLYISVATVDTHRTNLMAKLGVRNVAELVSRAHQPGFGAN
jgi:two-component system secretion response regulator SsrB